jgi:hypothetical protein
VAVIPLLYSKTSCVAFSVFCLCFFIILSHSKIVFLHCEYDGDGDGGVKSMLRFVVVNAHALELDADANNRRDTDAHANANTHADAVVSLRVSSISCTILSQ